MRPVIKFICCAALMGALLPASAWGKTELNLWKFSPFRYGSCGFCGDFVGFDENENRGEFTNFNLYYQDGYYTATLKGPAGTTVTLFGGQDYRADRGYLVIVKKDSSTVKIDDLEAFAPGRWVEQEAREGSSGAVSVYYQSSPNFKSNVASVKWGQWWSGATP